MHGNAHCNANIREVEARESGLQGKLWLQSNFKGYIGSQKKKKNSSGLYAQPSRGACTQYFLQ